MNPVRSALLAQVLYNHFLPETDTRLLKRNGKLKLTKIFYRSYLFNYWYKFIYKTKKGIKTLFVKRFIFEM